MEKLQEQDIYANFMLLGWHSSESFESLISDVLLLHQLASL